MQLILKKKNTNTTDRTFYIDEGSTYTENYNETLDSAEIRISHITSHLDIEPFDKVILHDENGNLEDKYMCVDSYTETMESLDPETYSYQISLFSETKELENVLLPNLSITRLSRNTKRSIAYYIQLYNTLYGPKVRRENTLWPKYSLDVNNPVWWTKFNRDCPEMQWNCPTLREVLNDLMMVSDCIVVLKNNLITFIDLTEKKSDISENENINYIQRSQSSEDYVSELKMDMLNVMQTSLDGVKQTVSRMEYQTFKVESDGYVVDSENLVLKTEYPILNIKHLWMIFPAWIATQYVENVQKADVLMKTYKVDLCNLVLHSNSVKHLVYEATEFRALKILSHNPTDFNTACQNLSLYFERGSSEIKGFYQKTKKYWLFNSKITTLTNLKDLIAENCYSIDGSYPSPFNVNHNQFDTANTYFTTFFVIEYETTADAVFKAGKDIAPTHERVVTDNQTNAYVDAYNQGFMEYQKVNRLGNHQLYINARYEDDFDDIIKIGDYYNDSIVYQTQYQIYKNHIEVNATATKNYILRDYFTGVKARIRSWKIADATQSFTRHDLVKYYLEFSKSSKEEYTTYNQNIAQYFLSPLYPTYIRPLKYCFMKSRADNGNYGSNVYYGYYSVDFLGRIVGNSIVFTFGINDNFTIGKRVSDELTDSDLEGLTDSDGITYTYRIKTSFTNKYGGVPLEDARYVDINGEFIDVEYHFTYDSDADYFKFPPETVNEQKNFMMSAFQLPYISQSAFTSYVKYHTTTRINKDNREMPKISTQFELCSDSHDIIFTRKFLELQECIRELTSEEQQVQTRSFTNTLYVSDFIQIGGPTDTVASIETPFDGSIIVADDTRINYKDYEVLLTSLYGKTLQSVVIEDTTTQQSNTVNFDNNYSVQNPITHQWEYYGRFYGRIYTYDDNEQEATITYVRDDAPIAYWIESKAVSVSGLAGQRVTNIQVSGFTPTSNDELTVTFNQTAGNFNITLKTYTQPVSNITLTITYDLVLQDGTYVANTVKIYRDEAENFDWRNPTLGDAQLTSATLTFTHNNKYSKIAMNFIGDVSDKVFYITDVNDNILLAVKGVKEFYLNTLLSRDYNVYDANGNVVGNI